MNQIGKTTFQVWPRLYTEADYYVEQAAFEQAQAAEDEQSYLYDPVAAASYGEAADSEDQRHSA